MSSITFPTGTIPTAQPGETATIPPPPAETSTSAAALPPVHSYGALFSTSSFEILGISPSRTPDDAAAILAAAQLALEETIAEARNNKAEAAASGLRGVLGNMEAAFKDLTALSVKRTSLEKEKKTTTDQLTNKTKELDKAKVESSREADNVAYREERLAEHDERIAKAEADGNKDEVAALTAMRPSLVKDLEDAVKRQQEADAKVVKLEKEVATLTKKVERLTSDIEKVSADAEELQATILNVYIPLAQAYANELLRTEAAEAQYDLGIEQQFENLDDIAAERSTHNLERIDSADLARDTALEDELERRIQKIAEGFIAGLVSALQVFSDLFADPPPSAMLGQESDSRLHLAV